MTPEEFKRRMQICANNSDIDVEHAHFEADNIIIGLLIELGYDEGARIFDDMEKWYS